MSGTFRGSRHWAAAVLPFFVALAGCGESDLSSPSGPATGFGATYDGWRPGPNDTCTREIHNKYVTVAPDGKLYPTWHPPVDPETGCTFGHEHGRDPHGSNLYAQVGDIPFGYALAADHVGYKIEWQNDVEMHFQGDAANSLFDVRCDVMVELHQGSHSPGALANNLHEMAYHANCTDGTRLHIQMISAIGHAGEFEASCDRRTIPVQEAPPDAHNGGGARLIPDRQCVDEEVLVPDGERSDYGGLRESWQIGDGIRTADGRTLVSLNPYFQVLYPSRYYDPNSPDLIARPIDLCFLQTADGRKARGGPCEESAEAGADSGVPFDDPISAFRGARRFVDVNSIRISNADGPQIWYTDKYGKNARKQPFKGSIRQFIAAVDNDRAAQPSGPAIGQNRDYGRKGVHSPN